MNSSVERKLQLAMTHKHPLVAVHRGSPGGSIVENTALAVTAALAEGADIVEIDVIRSTDGDFFVFHNGYEKHYFDMDRDIRDLSTAELEALQYEVFVAASAKKYGLEKLSTMLTEFPDTIFNIDRSWCYWDSLLAYLDQFGCADRVLLKAPAKAPEVQYLSQHSTKYAFMPIVETKEELDYVLALTDVNMIAVEVLATHENAYFADAASLQCLKNNGLFVFLNALNLASRKDLYLGWDDESSVLGNPNDGWGKLIAQGADIIQTDWPGLLNSYIATRQVRGLMG